MIRLVSAFHLSASAPYLIWKLLILSLAISPKTAYQHLPKNRVGRLPCRGFFTLPISQGIVAASTHTHTQRHTGGTLEGNSKRYLRRDWFCERYEYSYVRYTSIRNLCMKEYNMLYVDYDTCPHVSRIVRGFLCNSFISSRERSEYGCLCMSVCVCVWLERDGEGHGGV